MLTPPHTRRFLLTAAGSFATLYTIMPITKSAKKALRQSLRRAKRNAVRKKTYKKLVRIVRKSSASGSTGTAVAPLPQLYQALDKAAKTGVIHKNKASRLKSRLASLATKKKMGVNS